jgi:hypothetical protein
MPPPVPTNFLKNFGVTPWQFTLAAACIGSWWATVQPLPGQLAQLNTTVQTIATKVEIHSVLLQSVADLRGDIQQMRKELSTIEGKLSNNTSYNSKNLSRNPNPNEP